MSAPRNDEGEGAQYDVPIALIAAVSENGVIGHDGDMPWRLPQDLKWFRKNTMGKPVIMGRKTWASIGKALPGRANIIITRSEDFALSQELGADVYVVHSLEAGLERAQICARESGASEICIIGGGEIYRQTLDRAQRLYMTRVMASLDGDTVFPPIDSQNWTITRHGEAPQDAKNSHPCEFFIFDRKS